MQQYASPFTSLLDQGVSLEDVQRLTDHADTYTTRLYDRRVRNVEGSGLVTRFEVLHRETPIGGFEVRMPGVHNVLNSLAVIAIADECGVPHETTREALRTFEGVQRRFTVLGEVAGVTVIDDYGHHPTEVAVVLETARQAYGRRIVVAFQPHRYSRTRDLFEELTRAFNAADVLFLTDVYPAGEDPIEGADSAALAAAIAAHGHRDVTLVPDRADLAAALQKRLTSGDVVITLGAGTITRTGPELLAALRASDDVEQANDST